MLALVVCSGILAAIAPRRPWLIALAVGGLMPLQSIVMRHSFAPLVAIGFALVGAYIGAGIVRAVRSLTRAGHPG